MAETKPAPTQKKVQLDEKGLHPVTSQPDRPVAIVPEGELEEEAIHMPDPSIYPLILAVGVAIALFGIPFFTTRMGGLSVGLLISLPGVLVLAWGLVGWLLEDMHNAANHH